MGIDPDLVARFNASVLGVQWQVVTQTKCFPCFFLLNCLRL